MATFDWDTHGVVTTEEATLFSSGSQQLWEIWSAVVLDSGAITPKRIGDALGGSFKEAVMEWAEGADVVEFIDPLTLSYSGLPLVDSREAAIALTNQLRASQLARNGH